MLALTFFLSGTLLTVFLAGATKKKVIVEVKAVGNSPATMADYWSGKARWEFIRKYTIANTGWNGGFMAGDQVYILNGNWYLFSRKVVSGILTTEVRKSIDEGASWSAPVDIIPENAKWGVAATDGSVFYNQAENRWYFLFQCLAVKDGPWFGCLLIRDGMDPMGQFSEKPGVTNPVISAKEIWSKICNSSGDHCVQIPGGTNRVYDEGTFNIFELKNGYYFVAFHGYDGKNGFRSIAKTMDFNNWIAGDAAQGVPDDSVFDKFDSDIWREGWQGGSIGGGAGSILFDNSYYYQVVEGADINLACTKDQKWDFGIYRSASLTNKQWEPYPLGNPIVYSSLFLENHPYCNTGATCIRPCNVQYAHLFRDSVTNKTYFAFSRETEDSNYRGIYLYKLTADNNLLKNADLWKCNGDNWNRTGSTTNLAVYRYPNQSSDGNCYLATNCGSSTCTGDYSIFQDVDITPGSLPNVEFGGKFATDIQSGNADLYLWELSSDFTPLANHKITAALNTSYQEIKGTTMLRSDTAKLRFQLYLHIPNVTFKADEMYLQPYVPSPTPTPTPTPIPCPLKTQGDANCDGVINILDFEIWRREFLRIDTTTKADFDSSGGVSILDFEIWRRGFLGQ